jgi:hypothetical protein
VKQVSYLGKEDSTLVKRSLLSWHFEHILEEGYQIGLKPYPKNSLRSFEDIIPRFLLPLLLELYAAAWSRMMRIAGCWTDEHTCLGESLTC